MYDHENNELLKLMRVTELIEELHGWVRQQILKGDKVNCRFHFVLGACGPDRKNWHTRNICKVPEEV
jgi:hypothetical protein